MIFEKSIERKFRQTLFVRCDNTGMAYYFSAADFPGLRQEPYAFTTVLGDRLQGYFYAYENAIPDRLIVFDHGHGAGHRAYMKEIELLCRHGFRVFAYDHTGCWESEGAGCNGFTQSLSDLRDALTALKADGKAKAGQIAVMGHSWGGFAALNVAAFHPDVTHVVVLSGFVSLERILAQNFPGLLKPYRKGLYEINAKVHPDCADADGVRTLQNSRALALLIYSDNDPLVKVAYNYEPLREALAGNDRITLRLEQGKGHNPNYTTDAVAYLGAYLAAKNKFAKNGRLEPGGQKANFVASFDWDRMTAQDEAVWQAIFDHLDRKNPDFL